MRRPMDILLSKGCGNEEKMSVIEKIFGTHSSRELKRIEPLVDKIEALRPTMQALSDEELRGKTEEYKKRLAEGETLDDLLPEAYATVREAAKRVLNMEHYRVQLIGGIILGYIWQQMINAVLLKYETTLVANPTYGFWGLVILMNWQMIGYMMIIYVAGLQNVPTDLIEAAQIDGATSLQTLFKVKIPMVMPSITICLFLTVSNSFKLFDQNLALTAGAPSKKTAMLALDIYNTFYGRNGYEGVGQAKAVLFFIVVAVIALGQLVLTRRKEVEQ